MSFFKSYYLKAVQNMEPTFKVAEDSDADLLVEFMRELYAFDQDPFDDRRARAALEGLLKDASLGRVWLIHEGDRAVGYVAITFGYSLEYGGPLAVIDELYLRAGHRGQGLGPRALKFV